MEHPLVVDDGAVWRMGVIELPKMDKNHTAKTKKMRVVVAVLIVRMMAPLPAVGYCHCSCWVVVFETIVF